MKNKLTRDYVLKNFGFSSTKHFTIGNTLTKGIGRNRVLSYSHIGTTSEMLIISEFDEGFKRPPTEDIVLHNYDYDGYLTEERLRNLLDFVNSGNSCLKRILYSTGTRVVKEERFWIESEFDFWGAGLGVGIIVNDEESLGGSYVDVKWPNGKAYQNINELKIYEDMEILTQIKKDNLGFRKIKDTVKSNLTTTIIGSIQNEIKNNPNKDEKEIVYSTLRMFKKNLEKSPSSEDSNIELELINSYLPSMMTFEEVKSFIEYNYNLENYPVKNKLIGTVMKDLKNKAEGKIVSSVIKSL